MCDVQFNRTGTALSAVTVTISEVLVLQQVTVESLYDKIR